jgi:hypothetical protein
MHRFASGSELPSKFETQLAASSRASTRRYIPALLLSSENIPIINLHPLLR